MALLKPPSSHITPTRFVCVFTIPKVKPRELIGIDGILAPKALNRLAGLFTGHRRTRSVAAAPTESEPALPVQSHVGTGRTASPRAIPAGMPPAGPAGDRQQPTVAFTSPSYPSTCWGQAASLQGGIPPSPGQDRWDSLRRQQVPPGWRGQ